MLQTALTPAERIAAEVERLLTLATEVLSDGTSAEDALAAIEHTRNIVHREVTRAGEEDGFIARAGLLLQSAVDGIKAFVQSPDSVDYHHVTRVLTYAGLVMRYALIVRGAGPPVPTWPDVPRAAGWRSIRADRAAQTSKDTLLWVEQWAERVRNWNTPADLTGLDQPLEEYTIEVAAIGADGVTPARVEAVANSAKALRRAFDECIVLGPTPMPLVNRVVNLAHCVTGGWYRVEVLLHYIEKLRNELLGEAEAVQQCATSSSSPEMLEQIKAIDNYYQQLQRGLDLLRTAMSGHKASLSQGEELMVKAVAGLERCRAALFRLGQMDGKQLCMYCGHASPQTRRLCDHCGATFKGFSAYVEPKCLSVVARPEPPAEAHAQRAAVQSAVAPPNLKGGSDVATARCRRDFNGRITPITP